MIKFNEEKFPVVYVYIDGVNTIQDLQTYLNRFDNWLSRQEYFGIILQQNFPQQAQEKPSKEVKKLEIEWSKKNKHRISKYCLGMAIVIDSKEIFEKWQPIASQSILNMFGCPGQVFAAIPPAEEWIAKQMHDLD